jgi:hypothetical protein
MAAVRLSVADHNWANLFPLPRQQELDLAVVDVGTIVATGNTI